MAKRRCGMTPKCSLFLARGSVAVQNKVSKMSWPNEDKSLSATWNYKYIHHLTLCIFPVSLDNFLQYVKATTTLVTKHCIWRWLKLPKADFLFAFLEVFIQQILKRSWLSFYFLSLYPTAFAWSATLFHVQEVQTM